MSNLIKKNYKLILTLIVIACLIPLFPVLIEIIFKLGTIVGSTIRTLSTCH